jgi:ATP-dependent protease ClpP protease subunit
MANEINLSGSVGATWWGEEYFTAQSVREQLANLSGPVTVKLNSGGGVATEGAAIYNALVDYPGEVTVEVVAVAASAASLIAMAGDRIVMRLGAWMLIHDPAQPWTEGRGTEEDHVKLAAQLAVTSNVYAEVYAKRSGMSIEAVRDIMRAETILDGAAAVELGFADERDGAGEAVMAARFDYRIYQHAPAALRLASETLGNLPGKTAVMAMIAGAPRPKLENNTMTDSTKVAAQTAATGVVPAANEPQTPAIDPTVPTASANLTIAERNRSARILNMVALAGLPASDATPFIENGTSAEDAATQIMKTWAKGGDVNMQIVGAPVARVGMEAREKFQKGAELALMAKVGIKGGERNEFSSLSLSEMARATLEHAGDRSGFNDKREMIGRALTMAGTHTTSDFANILSNVLSKSALVGWEEAEETFELWTRKGVLTDFKASKRVGAGLAPSLRQVPEGADYKYITVGDRGETITLATYGELLRISRQAIINDDLSILGTMPRKMGRAAKRTIGSLVYAILTGNPAMSDGVALFHADHTNLGTGGAPSITTLSEAKKLMRTQKEAAGGPALNITPKYMIVPASLEVASAQLLNSAVDPTANKGHAANPVAGMAELIVDGRLDTASATAWYLAADPNAFDTIEVAYLDGNDAPFIEQQDMWTADGVEMKVRIDAAAAALDFRTLLKNAGA